MIDLMSSWPLLSCYSIRWLIQLCALVCIMSCLVCGSDHLDRFFHIPNLSRVHPPLLWNASTVSTNPLSYHCALLPEYRTNDLLSWVQSQSDLSALPWEPGAQELDPSINRLEIGATYDRAQCFLSLSGGKPMGSGLFKSVEPISQISMGLGLRYQWSDAIALQLAATLHYVRPSLTKIDSLDAPSGIPLSMDTDQPMSDLNKQVNGLSSPSQTTFAEGLLTIVYSFCK